jgi:dTDP-4-dehydrorhamnose 3,5-epimerase
MQFRKTFIEGPYEFTPTTRKVENVQITETYNQILLESNGFNYKFIQDETIVVDKGVFIGIHCQMPPYTQGKLVTCLKGKIIDFAIDLRRGSDTYGQWESVILDSEKMNQFWIPPGFGHAYYSLEDGSELSCRSTNLYDEKSEVVIDYRDEDFNLPLRDLKDIKVSKKDSEGISFMEFNKKNPW